MGITSGTNPVSYNVPLLERVPGSVGSRSSHGSVFSRCYAMLNGTGLHTRPEHVLKRALQINYILNVQGHQSSQDRTR